MIHHGNPRLSNNWLRSKNGFNVFATRVGAGIENQFPEDYEAVNSDQFSIALAHEYAHNLDSVFLARNDSLKRFRERLLAMAGRSHTNYLRSMISDGFFVDSPQEFVASVANQFFCDTARTLEYAIRKYEQGNPNQINQFVLLASALSDSLTASFFRIDEKGTITSSRHPSTKRDDLIVSLIVNGYRYVFEYSGGVINRVRVDAT
jgi:hypothetical protein